MEDGLKPVAPSEHHICYGLNFYGSSADPKPEKIMMMKIRTKVQFVTSG